MRRESSSLGILGGPSAIGYSVMDTVTGFASEDFEKTLAAITDFFNKQTPAIGSKPAQIKDEFSKWVNGLSWWDKASDKQAILDKAKNYKYDYDVAVTPTYGSPAAVAERAQYGSQFDSSRSGEGVVAAKTTSGRIAEAPKAGLPWKWILLGTGVAAVLVFAYAAPKALVGGAFSRKPKTLAANPGKRRKARR